MGAYVKAALSTTVLVAGLAEKNISNKMPKYPEMPYNIENDEDIGGMSEERLKAERLKAYLSFKILADNYKRQHKK